MWSHMSVKMQEDPLNLHIFHLDVLVMKNRSNKDLQWPLLELLKSSSIPLARDRCRTEAEKYGDSARWACTYDVGTRLAVFPTPPV